MASELKTTDIPEAIRADVESLRTFCANDEAAWSALCSVMRALAAQPAPATVPDMDESSRVPDDYRSCAAAYRAGWNDRAACRSAAQPATVPEGTPMMPPGTFHNAFWKSLPANMQAHGRMLTQSWAVADSTELKNALEAGILALAAAPSPATCNQPLQVQPEVKVCPMCNGDGEGYLPNGDGPYLCNACEPQPEAQAGAGDDIDHRFVGHLYASAQPAEGGAVYGIIDPDYARIFTVSRCIAWAEGYALMMHGSFTRDLDLIAVPWADRACDPQHLVNRIVDAADLKLHDSDPFRKPHDRLVWTLRMPGFGDPRWVDFSVLPTATAGSGEAVATVTHIKFMHNEATIKYDGDGANPPFDVGAKLYAGAPPAAGQGEALEWTEDRLREHAKSAGWYIREGTSVPTASGDWRHPFDVTVRSRDLCDLLNRLAGGKGE